MMFAMEIDSTVDATPAALWQTWTDVARFPSWDPREEVARLDGAFEVGATVWTKQRGNPGGAVTITEVVPERAWRAEKPLPGGKLVIDHRIEPLDGGRVRVSKRYEAHGPMSLLFRLVFARQIRRDVPASFAALEREAQRVAGASTTAG